MNKWIRSALTGTKKLVEALEPSPRPVNSFSVGEIRVSVSEPMSCGHRDVCVFYTGLPEGEVWIGFVNSSELKDLVQGLQAAAAFIDTLDSMPEWLPAHA